MADQDLWEAEFPITFVTRRDLVRAGVPIPVARALTDEQMQAIATKMTGYYVQHDSGGFWEQAKAAVEYVTKQPQQQLSSTQQTQAGQEMS